MAIEKKIRSVGTQVGHLSLAASLRRHRSVQPQGAPGRSSERVGHDVRRRGAHCARPESAALAASKPTADAESGVYVVDDSDVFLDALREVFEACPEFELVGEAHNGEIALSEVPRLAPDLVLLDVILPGYRWRRNESSTS